MPPSDGLLRSVLPASTELLNSSPCPSNRYDQVNLSDNSTAVVGTVVHQHFYPSRHDATTTGDNSTDQAVELRNRFSERQIDSLSNYDHQYAHELHARRRIPSTCEWITRLPEFKNWAMGNAMPILVCVGSVGCGKSITASAVIDWLNMVRVSPDPFALSYYVDPARPQPPTTSDVLRAFLKQITLHYKVVSLPMPADLQSQIAAILTSVSSATSACLTAVIKHFLRLQPSSYVVVDGIDALSEPEILVFVKFLREVWSTESGFSPFGRLILFCRETLGRRIRLDGISNSIVLQVRLEHLESDIHTYVDSQVSMKQQECPITSDDDLLNEVKTALKLNSEKMFLWVHLQVLSLWDPGMITCDQDIRDQLKSLPEGLDEIYLRCLRRINTNNDKRSQEIAPRMFRWLASAQSTFSPLQAREAVSMTPTNLPVDKSQILSFPVTDYCANLVVLDDLTGTVKFAHPSVKEFLSDSDKIRPEVRHLSLLNEEEELWCGRICVAHAKLHNSRQQVVVFRSQQIQPKIASPIVRNIFATLSPLNIRPRPSKTQSEPFRMPVSTVSTCKTSLVEHSSLHNYIRWHWLDHNVHISKDHPHYTDFENLCLAHDPDLLPWSTSRTKNVEHYRLMVHHAVMLNHRPLLLLARTAIEAKGPEYQRGVFDRFAPGTDSTYLHCAIALGHIDVLRVLLDIPGYDGHLADAQGTSAAAAAMKAQQMEAFDLILGKRVYSLPVWSTVLPSLERQKDKQLRQRGHRPTERILDLAVIEGNLRAARSLLSSFSVEDTTEGEISSTFFLACKYGRQSIGELLAKRLLVTYIGNSRHLYSMAELDLIEREQTEQDSNRSVSRIALETLDPKMMMTLLSIKRNVGLKAHVLDLKMAFNVLGGRPKDWYPFIELALQFNVSFHIRGEYIVPWSLATLLERIRLGTLTYRELDDLARLILHSFDRNPRCKAVAHHEGQTLPGKFEWKLFEDWIKNAADDVLGRVIDKGWFHCQFLASPACTDAAFERGSSRVLECIVGFATRCATCEGGAFKDEFFLDHWLQRLDSEAFRSMVTWFEIGPDQALSSECLLYSSFVQNGNWASNTEAIRWRPNLIARKVADCIRAYKNDRQQPLYPCLMWTRCYDQMKGDVSATRALCHDLHLIGADGNFNLNFPAGYCRRHGDPKWEISPNIWLAVHRWSFRLNRAHGKPFSESDIWYMARLLKSPVGRSTA